MSWSFDLKHVSGTKIKLNCIVGEIVHDVILLSKVCAGKVPRVETICNSEDYEDEIVQQIREEHLSGMLAMEICQQESAWVNYEFEETQIKFDIADMVLEDLAEDTYKILEHNF